MLDYPNTVLRVNTPGHGVEAFGAQADRQTWVKQSSPFCSVLSALDLLGLPVTVRLVAEETQRCGGLVNTVSLD